MNFIKNIFEDRIDDDVKKQFRRFGKGRFENRAVVEMSVGKGVKVKTSFEYANEFVKFLAETVGEKVRVCGGIITIKDIKKDLDFEFSSVKQFAGVKTYHVDAEVSKENLLGTMDKFPDALFCLSFFTEYGDLKIKVKSPKSAKSSGEVRGEKVKANYCVFNTKDLNFKNEFAFDVKEKFRKFSAVHDFIIEELIVPEEYKNDPAMARLFANRRGKIIRKLNIDGREVVKEKSFIA